MKSPVLYKIVDRKNRESVIHHDRLKLCRDAEHPGWVKRLRNKILSKTDTYPDCPISASESDESNHDLYNLSDLFNPDNDVSDVLIHQSNSDVQNSLTHQNKPDESDVLTHQQVSDFGKTKGTDSSGLLGRHKRSRKMPQYLSDYVQFDD